MLIVFKRIRYKNFLSTGDDWTEIQLNKSPTTLIMGKNGSGKSTLLDALTFGLFGTPFRNINVPELVNDTNGADMVVEVEFSIGRKNYKIRRGLKPRVFEIYENNKLVDQDAKARDYQKYLEQSILKLSKKTFTQVVVLGSASFVPFMQLDKADRRFIIEDLLDIQIFSAMNVALKQKVSEMKDEYISLSNQIEIQTEKVALVQSYLKKVKADNASAIGDKKRTIVENQEQKESTESQIESVRREISELLATVSDESNVKTRVKKLESTEDKLESNKSKTQKELVFFQDNNQCPTCKQDIDHQFKTDMMVKKTALIGEIEQALTKLTGDLKTSEDRLDDIRETMRNVGEKEKKIGNLQSSIQATNKFIKKVQAEIEDLQNNGGGSASEQQKKLKSLQGDLKEMARSRDELTARKHYLDIVAVMLKDTGIKTKIIKQYLPIINRYVNKFLAAMDFFANFTLDENFKEVIHVHGSKERNYYQLSEGQKLRIDLGILFTWREVASLKNQANTNLLIMDEIFESALDDTGVEDFLKLIQNISKNVNIFIISPKGDSLIDKFTNTIKFSQDKGFSVMEEAA